MSEKPHERLVVWFRRDLRVEDNTALAEACAQAREVIPLFVLDDAILTREDTGPARVVFLLDALRVLDANLKKCGARLIVRHGKNPETLLRLVEEFKADGVFFHREYEPWGRERDVKVAQELAKQGKVCRNFKDIVLFDPDEISTKEGKPYTVFTPYKRVWFETPAPAPRIVPEQIAVPADVMGDALPTAAGLGVSSDQTFHGGGEDAAKKLLSEFADTKLADYKVERNALAHEGTSRLSRHLHLGTSSPRTIAAALRGKQGAEPFLNEIAWRDFYFQILHHFPHVTKGAFRPVFDKIAWENDETHFRAWCEGRTGYPIVDAAMRQMNQEAWMHNRGRMITASFLTKDLLINWQEGERYFMQKLVDGDQAANNGGWQWAAGTGTDAQPFFRIFNPVTQGETFDPQGEYVRRYVPELRRVPDKVIHAPWKLTELEQQAIGCVLGKDYPKPIVDHGVQRQKALALYSRVKDVQETS